MPEWIDAHCHLADSRFTADLPEVLARSREAGVGTWIQGGVDPEDWSRQIELRRTIGPAFVTAFGLHPWWISQQEEAEVSRALDILETQLTGADAPRALGELGLDLSPRHGGDRTLPRQEPAFRRQLELGKSRRLPLVLHIVGAHAQALAMLERLGPFPQGGLVHSFSSSREVAESYLSLGFTISVGGSATREGFQSLKKALRYLPPERLVIETDSPDQLPNLPEPGKARTGRNEPANLPGIAEVVARLRGEERDPLLSRSARNLKSIFGVGK